MGVADDVVPIVLAAGGSRRMGRPKALLPFGARTALEVIVDVARDAGAARAIVVVEPGTAVEAHAASLDVAVATNPHPERGQASSLQVGLAALPAGAAAFFMWPVDHPLATATDVRALVDAFRAGAPIAIPSHARRRGHPVLVSTALTGEFLALSPGETARSIVARHADRVAHVDASADVLADMDTPDDYERCAQRFLARAEGGA
jgi:CTP:molybdopterin cytidylyltransferase MocA